ncbi:MAG: 30S ribosomal protein S7 [Candidatus Micrarchaeaceae archaeon]
MEGDEGDKNNNKVENSEQEKANVEAKEEKNVQKKPAIKKQVQKRKEAQAKEAVERNVASEVLLFEKYSYDVEVTDLSLANYISLRQMKYPMSFRRDSQMKFSKANINIVERLANALMRGGTGGKIGGKVIRTKGRLQGKKIKVMHIIENAFDKISKKTNQNPLQVYINALQNSAPIEDTTRVRYGGVIMNVAVDISASRRLDIALRNIAIATVMGAFANKKTFEDALAEELMLAADNNPNSYAIKRKENIERMARSAK